MIRVTENELSPVLHFARIIEITPEYNYNGIVAYDARMIYVLGGAGEIEIEGARYGLSPGTLMMWQAGSEYGFPEVKISPMKVMMLNFDFAGELYHTAMRTPSPRESFDVARIGKTAEFVGNADERGVFVSHEAFWAESGMREILSEYTARKVFSGSVTRGIITVLAAKLSRNMRLSESGENEKRGRYDEIIEYINAHLSERLTYESLGKEFSYHPNHISRIITKLTGLPLHRYLLRLRMEKAYGMLTDEGLSVSETARLCGFSDAAAFTKRFRKEFGFSPRHAAGCDPALIHRA